METGEEETRVVYMLSKILQLSIGSCDLSQAEKKITAVTSRANSQNTIITAQN